MKREKKPNPRKPQFKINFQNQISFNFWMGIRGVIGLWVELETKNWEIWGWVHKFGRQKKFETQSPHFALCIVCVRGDAQDKYLKSPNSWKQEMEVFLKEVEIYTVKGWGKGFLCEEGKKTVPQPHEIEGQQQSWPHDVFIYSSTFFGYQISSWVFHLAPLFIINPQSGLLFTRIIVISRY